MSEKLLRRLEKYLETASEEKMNRVNEVAERYAVHKLNNNALEACLLQVRQRHPSSRINSFGIDTRVVSPEFLNNFRVFRSSRFLRAICF
ncbi:MAG: hypothetical protein ACI9VM_000165 [Candidatus Azotimanducaceae bacterium]|jgi:hypothetical protein